MNHYKTNRLNLGFSVIEIIVSISIFSIVIMFIGYFIRDTFKYENIFSGGLSAYDQEKKVLQPIASEIRSAIMSASGGYPIESANTTSFVFFSDTDSDGIIERIRYYLNGNTLLRGVIIPSGTPIQYISDSEISSEVVTSVRNGETPIFTYYDSEYTGATSPISAPVNISLIRLIKINLIVDEDPNEAPLPVSINTQVSVRNLKDNY